MANVDEFVDPEHICGNYCQKLPSDSQKNIIKSLMRKHLEDIEQKTDLNFCGNKANSGHPNDRKYILDARWWRNWCDFSGYEQFEQEPKTADQSIWGRIGKHQDQMHHSFT